MGYNYFNKIKFEKANSLIGIDPLAAKCALEDYLSKYPKDYNAYSSYIYVLTVLDMPEDALEMINYVESIYFSNSNFIKCYDKVKRLEHDLFLNKLRVLALQEKYEKLYNYYLENKSNYFDIDFGSMYFVCLKKLGLLRKNVKKSSYIRSQIIDYSEDVFLEHVQKHQADFNDSLDEPNKNIFSSDFPINEVINEVKKYIPSEKKLCTNMLSDTYVFRYDDCGRDDNRIVNYFKIICFHNTTEFVTMCPCFGCERLPYVDLNYLCSKNSKVKQISQIEKFNRRFTQKK